MTGIRRESVTDAVRACGALLEYHVESMARERGASPAWRRRAQNVESSMVAYVKALDSALALAQEEGEIDPKGRVEIEALKVEAIEFERRVYRMLARAYLQDRPGEEKPGEQEVFIWSKRLFAYGTRRDVEVLTRAAKTFKYEFLRAHAVALEDRLNRHDPLGENEPKRVGAAVTEVEASLSEAWFHHHREDLRERYPHKFVAVCAEGVVAVDEDEERLASRIYALQLKIGRFWTYIGKPSLELEEEAPTRDSSR